MKGGFMDATDLTQQGFSGGLAAAKVYDTFASNRSGDHNSDAERDRIIDIAEEGLGNVTDAQRRIEEIERRGVRPFTMCEVITIGALGLLAVSGAGSLIATAVACESLKGVIIAGCVSGTVAPIYASWQVHNGRLKDTQIEINKESARQVRLFKEQNDKLTEENDRLSLSVGTLQVQVKELALVKEGLTKAVASVGSIPERKKGVLIANHTGKATPYSIFNLQSRGSFFIPASTDVYEGMIIGENAKDNDLCINITKGKQLTNVRASGSDENVILTPPRILTLEAALDFIEEDELIEVTPQSIRLRKIHLKEQDRKRHKKD